MAQTRVQVLNESKIEKDEGWTLCFQWCTYWYGEGQPQSGYRFIWRRPRTGDLQAARGQARIPSIYDVVSLVGEAISQGWGRYNGDPVGHAENDSVLQPLQEIP